MLYWGPVTTAVKNLIRCRIKELFCYFREVFLFNVEIQLKLLFTENTEVL